MIIRTLTQNVFNFYRNRIYFDANANENSEFSKDFASSPNLEIDAEEKTVENSKGVEQEKVRIKAPFTGNYFWSQHYQILTSA